MTEVQALIKTVGAIQQELERANDLKEKELSIKVHQAESLDKVSKEIRLLENGIRKMNCSL